MKENILLVIGNICVVAIFGFVACWFNKWWIILFSALFCFYRKQEKDDEEEEE